MRTPAGFRIVRSTKSASARCGCRRAARRKETPRRNDARPIGHDLPQAPLHERDSEARDTEARESVTHDRQSHIVNRRAEHDAKRDDDDVDPVVPVDD